MVMNCASNASAISRAMVVLPVPGGPHRMQLCGWPGFEGDAQRHALAQQMLLADHFAQRPGTQAFGQGLVGGGDLLVHPRSVDGVPAYWRTTSAPGGGLNWNCSGATAPH